jgi:hypothetical protein
MMLRLRSKFPPAIVSLATRFVVPVVVNGRVYFGTCNEVEVYGLLK